MRDFLRRYRVVILLSVLALVAVAVSELAMGRLLFGPDGRFGWWESDIWSAECSQRLADAYSLTHAEHGMICFGVLWLFARRVPVQWRFFASLVVECAWEIAENSPFIINRYRAVTISIGYEGDSVINSVSDAVFMALGFLLAARLPVHVTALLAIIIEVGCLFWVRDNLALNVLMLLWPVESVRQWQAALHPMS